MIKLQEVVHLPGLFNLISQSQIMDKDVKVEPVNHYGLNLYSCHGKVISAAPQIDGLFVLDRVLQQELTEYPHINNRFVLRRLGMYPGTMRQCGWYSTASGYTSA
jgi:hypothetical protein